MLSLFPLALVLGAAPVDSNFLADPGMETTPTPWTLWLRSPDSGTLSQGPASGCHAGTGCLEVHHDGAQDWGLNPPVERVPVHPGELWRWSLWIRTDSLETGASLGFVTRDASGKVMEWNASATPVRGSDKSWHLFQARITIPRGCAFLTPRLTGFHWTRILVDDAAIALESAAPTFSVALRLANDSGRLEVDNSDLSMTWIDSLGARDTLRMGNLPAFHLDSAARVSDTLRMFVHQIPLGWSARISAHLVGGSVRLALDADSAAPVSESFCFPGSIPSRSGQWIAIPRGTGVAWPVESPPNAQWTYLSTPYWDWQVSQTLAGVSDGRTGYVVTVDEPADTRMYVHAGPGGLSWPRIWQDGAKGVFSHRRTAMVAPVRGGGWAEFAQRHRARLNELGRVKTWERKIRENPEVEKMRGAVDWWVFGKFGWRSFDTLRWMGMEKAILHWDLFKAPDLDSLLSRGWVVSIYNAYSDCYPGDTGINGREYTSGLSQEADGSYVNAWLGKHPDGTPWQALKICPARHPVLARSHLERDQAKYHRNGRFIDVELAQQPGECFSAAHPQDRHADVANRLRALSIVKDSFRLVVGSEQTRDVAHHLVDYGEGPMSIATVADAGYSWATPEGPELKMDTLSMDPARRIPLVPLADHDGFSPTWYTGDGQSKVPARWDDKDLWNFLYATMPMISPGTRERWDSARVRYLRSINLGHALLSRCHFSAMTGWEPLSADRKVQRTTFSGGWSVAANFDAATRTESGTSLPAKGFLARGPDGRVERTLLDGTVRSRVRLSDRWFLDPEGSEATLDGIRTTGSFLLSRRDDTSFFATFVGDQPYVDLTPSALPWPANTVRAWNRTTKASVPVVASGSGWQRIQSSSTRFLVLSGDFQAFRDSTSDPVRVRGARLEPTATGWRLRWLQDRGEWASVEIRTVDGRRVFSRVVAIPAPDAAVELPRIPSVGWVVLKTESGKEVLTLPGVR